MVGFVAHLENDLFPPENVRPNFIFFSSDDNVTAVLVDVGGKLACSLDISSLRQLVEVEATSRMGTGHHTKADATKTMQSFKGVAEV